MTLAGRQCYRAMREEQTMAKKQEVTLVDALTADVVFSVSAPKTGVPETNGFIVRVKFAGENEKMLAALKTVVIRVQNGLRTYYEKHKRFPFEPGKRTAVDAGGEFYMPAPMPSKERLLAATLAEKIMIAETYGLTVPDEWRNPPSDEDDGQSDEDDETGLKYDEDELRKLSIARLRVLAQNEELEGYDDLTKDELVEELAMVEKQ